MFTRNSRNQYDRKDSLELGKSAEGLFARAAAARGWDVCPAVGRENIDDHFDYRIRKEGEVYRVEVKSKKRIGRSDATPQAEFVWIELHGVRSCDDGWLYGKADLIAFEMDRSFRIVQRADLLTLVHRLVNLSAKVTSSKDALYKVYSRAGRPDLLTMLRYEDLNEILWAEWEKEELL
ncbi:MAG: hypothetical protein AB1649_14085 [Chloroflexota bacterium]